MLLEDFGLTPLLWLPSGRPAAQLNPRYAAPELHEPTSSPTADQYSLALIYTEMLTGIYPREAARRQVGHAPPAQLAEPGSGLHRRPPPPGHRPAAAGRRVDLDFLPPGDRPVVARGAARRPRPAVPELHGLPPGPPGRHAAARGHGGHAASLPLVAPFACLMGKAPPARRRAPPTEQVAAELIAAAVGPVDVRETDNARYIVHPDGAWEYRFPIRMFASLMRLKLEGFRQQWNARPVERRRRGVHLPDPDKQRPGADSGRNPSRGRRAEGPGPLPAGRRAGHQPARGGGAHRPVRRPRPAPGRSCCRRRPRGSSRVCAPTCKGARSSDCASAGRSPSASASTRCWRIWRSAKPLEGRGRDVSLGGVRLLVAGGAAERVRLPALPRDAEAAPLAVLGRIVRVLPLEDGAYELGFTFVVDGPPGT